MDNKTDREEILNSIRQGLKRANFKHFEPIKQSSKDVFITPDKSLLEIFSDELKAISGECYYCSNNDELVEKLKELHTRENLELCYSPDKNFLEFIQKANILYSEEFENADMIKSGISSCEFLVARFGSVIVSSALPGGRRIFSFPEIHIVIAFENQLVMELEEGLEGITKKYGDDLPSQIINITGPSRTADIEKTLILGAHGPKKLVVLILKS